MTTSSLTPIAWVNCIFALLTWRPRKSGLYRVVRRWGGFEPQYSFTAGMSKGIFWYPLDSSGHWLEPDAFTAGNPTKRSLMSKSEAERAIIRARAINDFRPFIQVFQD